MPLPWARQSCTKHDMLVIVQLCMAMPAVVLRTCVPAHRPLEAHSADGWRPQVAASLSSSLNPAAEARPALPGPGQTLNLASTFAAAAAKATAVQPDLAPQVPTRACISYLP